MSAQTIANLQSAPGMPAAESFLCPKCQTPNPVSNYYCLQCGKKLKEPPVSTSIGKQILIYAVSFLLPPFGLGWAFAYMRQKNGKAKVIGWIALLLTIISIALTVWITVAFFNAYTKLLNDLSSGKAPDFQNNNILQDIKSLQ